MLVNTRWMKGDEKRVAKLRNELIRRVKPLFHGGEDEAFVFAKVLEEYSKLTRPLPQEKGTET